MVDRRARDPGRLRARHPEVHRDGRGGRAHVDARTRSCAGSATGSSTARTGSDRGSKRRRTTRSARSSSSPATRSPRSRCSRPAFVRWRHRVFFVGAVRRRRGHRGRRASVRRARRRSARCSRRSRPARPSGLAMRSTARAVPLVVLATAVLLGVGTNAVYAALRRNARPVLAVGSVGARRRAAARSTSPRCSTARSTARTCNDPRRSRSTGRTPRPRSTRGGDDTRVLELPGCRLRVVPVGQHGRSDHARPHGPAVRRARADPVGRPGHGRSARTRSTAAIQEGTLDPAGLRAARAAHGRRRRRAAQRHPVSSATTWCRRASSPARSRRSRGSAPRPASGRRVPNLPGAAARGRAHAAGAGQRSTRRAGRRLPGRRPDADRARRSRRRTRSMLAGDGEGLVDAADVGLLDGAGIVQYSGSYDRPARDCAPRSSDDTTLVLTDSNRRRGAPLDLGARQPRRHRATGREAAHGRPRRRRASTCSPADDDAARSTMDQQGVAWATATSYGNTITYTPEDRAARAFDGDVETAWRARRVRRRDRADDPRRSRRPDHHRSRQPRAADQRRPRSLHHEGAAALRRRRRRSTPSSTRSSRTATGQTIYVPDRGTFRRLEIEVTGSERRQPPAHGQRERGRLRRGPRSPTPRPARRCGCARWCRCRPICSRATGTSSTRPPARRADEPRPHRAGAAAQRSRAGHRARVHAAGPRASSRSPAPRGSRARPTRRRSRPRSATPPTSDGGAVTRDRQGVPRRAVLRAGREAAIDGDLATAWQTPFVGVRGQWARLPAPGADHVRPHGPLGHRRRPPLGSDAHPARGRRRRARAHAAADRRPAAAENATATVPLIVPRGDGPNRARDDRGRPRAATRSATSRTTSRSPRPAIAELGIPGLAAHRAARPSLGGECRNDLLRIDGDPVPRAHHRYRSRTRLANGAARRRAVRPRRSHAYTVADARRGITCVEAALGHRHRRAARPARARVRRRRRGRARSRTDASPTGRPRRRRRTSRSCTTAARRMRVHVDGADEPFWLVLGQSENAGWHATTDGAALGPRRLVDGYANGWLVDPTTDESFDVVLEWTPQRSVWASLWRLGRGGARAAWRSSRVTWWRRRAGALALVTAPDPADSQVSIEWPRSDVRSSGRAGFSPVLKVLMPVAVGARRRGASRHRGSASGRCIIVARALRWRFARVVLAVAARAPARRRRPVHRGRRSAGSPDATDLRVADRVPTRTYHGLARARAARRQRGLGDRSTGDRAGRVVAAVTSSPSTADLPICRSADLPIDRPNPTGART